MSVCEVCGRETLADAGGCWRGLGGGYSEAVECYRLGYERAQARNAVLERERDEARRWRAAWKRAAGLAYAIERARGAVKDSIFRRYRAAEQQAAAARAEYEKQWTADPASSVADLMREAVDEARAQHERFKARGGEIDRLEAELAAAQQALAAVAAERDGLLGIIASIEHIAGDRQIGDVAYYIPRLEIRAAAAEQALAAERERAGRLEALVRASGCMQENWQGGYDAARADIAAARDGFQRTFWCGERGHSCYCPCSALASTPAPAETPAPVPVRKEGE